MHACIHHRRPHISHPPHPHQLLLQPPSERSASAPLLVSPQRHGVSTPTCTPPYTPSTSTCNPLVYTLCARLYTTSAPTVNAIRSSEFGGGFGFGDAIRLLRRNFQTDGMGMCADAMHATRPVTVTVSARTSTHSLHPLRQPSPADDEPTDRRTIEYSICNIQYSISDA